MKRFSISMKKPNEKEIISIISDALGIADLDDVASVLGKRTKGRRRKRRKKDEEEKGGELVFKVDMLVASTDVPWQMQPWQIARKSIVAPTSDLAAKGAKPLAAMISLGIPSGVTRSYIKGLAKGFKLASKEFDVNIVGGDTNAAKELVIDCSMIGTSATFTSTALGNNNNKIPKRSGAKPGDAVIISGRFGYSASGLAILLKSAKAKGSFRRVAINSVLEPAARQKMGYALAKYFSSSIDSSDGLAASLYEIASASKVDIAIYNSDIVMADGVQEFAQLNGLDAHELVFYGGEEYEIVATVPKPLLPRARAAAKKAGCALYVIGKVVQKGSGKVMLGAQLLENRGYVHLG
jgi:thiamine-monophosphate kinase